MAYQHAATARPNFHQDLSELLSRQTEHLCYEIYGPGSGTSVGKGMEGVVFRKRESYVKLTNLHELFAVWTPFALEILRGHDNRTEQASTQVSRLRRRYGSRVSHYVSYIPSKSCPVRRNNGYEFISDIEKPRKF